MGHINKPQQSLGILFKRNEGVTMLIEKQSLFSGKTHIMDLPVTQEQIARWEEGAFIQDVMPELSDSEREFLISGMTDEEWTECWGEEE